MNKSILIVFVLMSMYLLSSCQKEDMNDLVAQIANSANKKTVEPENLPNTIVEFVDNNYFETYIEAAWEASGLGYELKMGNNVAIYFDSTHELLVPNDKKGHGHHSGPCGNMGGEPIKISDLPTNITDYIATNYANAEIKRAGLKRSQCYVVGLWIDGEKVVVLFDLEGTFIGTLGLTESNVEVVIVADLPTEITDYVAANYPNSDIKGAKNNGIGNYIVGLTGKIILAFDASGNFIEELPFVAGQCGCKGEEIEVSELPTNITDYVTTNYPTAEVKKAHQKGEKYVVGLIVDDERVILIFDADGSFITERP
ncbi:MAG: PepSY-like domain-containing protein [Chitinophagales bacterium]